VRGPAEGRCRTESTIRPVPLHAPERRLRHRAVDHGRLLWCRERGRNPVFESGHLRRRIAKIANGSAPHTASVRKAMSPAKTYAASKASVDPTTQASANTAAKTGFMIVFLALFVCPSGDDLIIPREAAWSVLLRLVRSCGLPAA
jgi:hypothetical protein